MQNKVKILPIDSKMIQSSLNLIIRKLNSSPKKSVYLILTKETNKKLKKMAEEYKLSYVDVHKYYIQLLASKLREMGYYVVHNRKGAGGSSHYLVTKSTENMVKSFLSQFN